MNKVGRRVGCVCAPGADPGPVTLSAAKRPIKEDMIKKLMAFTVMGLLFAPAIRQSPQAGAVWDNVSSYAKSTAAQWGATEGLSASAAPAAAHSVSDGHTHDLEADPVSTGEFTFLGTIDGEAVTWNRCAPIRYVVNQALVDAGINDELLLALADIEAASVFNFEFAGVVTHIPTSDWDARPPASALQSSLLLLQRHRPTCSVTATLDPGERTPVTSMVNLNSWQVWWSSTLQRSPTTPPVWVQVPLVQSSPTKRCMSLV